MCGTKDHSRDELRQLPVFQVHGGMLYDEVDLSRGEQRQLPVFQVHDGLQYDEVDLSRDEQRQLPVVQVHDAMLYAKSIFFSTNFSSCTGFSLAVSCLTKLVKFTFFTWGRTCRWAFSSGEDTQHAIATDWAT